MDTRGNFTYILVFICADTNWIHISPLRSKDGTACGLAAQRFLVSLGIHKLVHATTVYTDGDGQFRLQWETKNVKDFTTALLEFGVHHENIPPYCPQLNPAEKAIRDIFTSARALLADAGLDSSYVVEAAMTATYLHNRTSIRRALGRLKSAVQPEAQKPPGILPDQILQSDLETILRSSIEATTRESVHSTPFEMALGRTPSIKHLRPFGCTAYVTLEKQKKNKVIDPSHKAERGLFLGYASPLSDAYRVEVMDTSAVGKRTTITTVHVSFDSEEFGLLYAPVTVSGIPSSTSTPEPAHTYPLIEQFIDSVPSEELAPRPPGPGAAPPIPDLIPEQPVGNGGIDPGDPEVTIDIDNLDDLDLHDAVDHGAGGWWDSSIPGGQPNPDWLVEAPQGSTRSGVSFAKLANLSFALSVFAMKSHAEITIKTALSGPDKDIFIKAISKEKESIIKRKLVLLKESDPEWTKAQRLATPGRYVLTMKRNGDAKARAIVQGCFENPSIDGPDFNYYAHVAKLITVRAHILRGDKKHRTIATVDIKTAFLMSHDYTKDEPVRYVKFREPLEGNQLRYYRLKGPLYGQKSAPIRWEETLVEWLTSKAGFARGENEPCSFYRPRRDPDDEDDMQLVLYVDDILAGGNLKDLKQFFNELHERFPLRDIHWLTKSTPIDYIGMIISRDDENIYITMEEYCKTLVAVMEASMGPLPPASVPITTSITDTRELPPNLQKVFRTGIGSIGWLASTIRIDLAYAHSRISQHMAKPTYGAWEALKHAMSYIKGSPGLGLSAPLWTEENKFLFYTDADHAGNREPQNHCRSQLGFVCLLNNAPILWKSATQTSVSVSPLISTTLPSISVGEAEVYAITNGIMEFMHLSYVMNEMLILGFPSPMMVQTDSTVAEAFMSNTCLKTRMKHIDVRQNWVKLIRNASIAKAIHCSSAQNKADWLTKILSKSIFLGFRSYFMKSLPWGSSA